MDTKTPEGRSLNMSHIRSKDTKPEKWFENIFFMRDSDIEKRQKTSWKTQYCPAEI